jgi:hypothetical protein
VNRVQVVLVAVLSVLLAGGVVAGTNVVDVDGDGIPAATELAEGTNPLAADTDGDGLADDEEARYGTNPRVEDTDGDGLTDGREVHELGTSPTAEDSDGDGLSDGAEVNEYGTDPLETDTDGDGLSDGREIEDTSTNPNEADTDGDGLSDGAEVREYSTDPTAPDTDGDGLDDGREVEEFSTDPKDVDTDGDGLEDGYEVETVGTDPTESDTDRDGLDDAREHEVLGTDPTDRDTDNDGLADGYEAAESGPLSEGDPLRRDVFLEVDYMASEKPNPEAIDAVQEAYANAPIENPDGSTGITLHVVVDDEVEHEAPTTMTDLTVIMFDNFDHNEQGYHYAVAVEDVEREDGTNLGGLARSGSDNGQFIYQTDYPESDRAYPTDVEASLFMHELGHSVGLGSYQFEGIDSREFAYENYSSVMNYNAPYDELSYSSGEPFDDWGYIESNLYTPVVRAGAMNETDSEAEPDSKTEAETDSAARMNPQGSSARASNVH